MNCESLNRLQELSPLEMQMPPQDLFTTLVAAEKSASVLSQALLLGQAELVEVAARELQQCALALSEGLQGVKPGRSAPGQALQRRLAKVAQTIAMQREACARRSAVVEMSLHSIVPATRCTTYSSAAGPYARNAKQSGAFKLLSA